MAGGSDGYHLLRNPEEIADLAKLDTSWQNPNMPTLQWMFNAKEFEKLSDPVALHNVRPFDSFEKCLKIIKNDEDEMTSFLDIGCSSGQYHMALRTFGYKWEYLGVDYSPYFVQMARERNPGTKFATADITRMPFLDNSFDIVFVASVLQQISNWEVGLREAARVAHHWVLFHRVPLHTDKANLYFRKKAYGEPCSEIWFSHDIFFNELEKTRLIPVHMEPIFEQNLSDACRDAVPPMSDHKFGHYSILCHVIED